MLSVGSYPEVSRDEAPPALPCIRVVVNIPIYVNPNEDGWWSCKIADFETPEWRVDDAMHKPLGMVT
jgi:hypothetical protein